MSTTPKPISVVVPVNSGDPAQIRQFMRQTATALDVPINGVSITAEAEVANVRRFRLQVVDRARSPVHRVTPVLFWFSTDGGAPGGTQTVAVTTGTVLATLIANKAFWCLSDVDGTIIADVTVSGVSHRFIRAAVLGIPTGPDQFDWT